MTDLDSARPRARRLDPSPEDLPPKGPLSEDIEQKQFETARRGYETHEVRAYLHIIAIHLDGLERELERSIHSGAQLEQQLERTELELRLLQAELVEQRLLHREASSRLELCDALREDALTRAGAAEAGRQHAEDLLAQVVQSYRPHEREPAATEDRPAPPPAPTAHVASAGQSGPPWRGAEEVPDAAAEPGPRRGATYILTAEQIQVIERAVAEPAESTRAHAARILEGARRDADRIHRAAQETAQLWDQVGGELRDRPGGSVPGEAPRTGVPAGPAPGDGVETRASETVADRPAGAPPSREAPGVPAVRFTTNQARAAAVALHSSARDDLRLAEFWIQEAEQDASEDASVTSRIILEEARQLLTMAAELGHPAPELLEQYIDLDRRARRPRA